MLTEMEKAYIAGVIDSDGCIHVDKCNGKNRPNPSYNARVQIAATYREVCEWVKEKVGGPLRSYIYTGESKNHNRKPVYTWKISGQMAIDLCKEIEPYLLYKKPRAQVLIEFESTLLKNRPKKNGQFCALPEEIRAKKEELYNKMKILNRRGACPGTNHGLQGQPQLSRQMSC